MTTGTQPAGDPTPVEMPTTPADAPSEKRTTGQSAIKQMMASSGVLIFSAILLAMIIGALLVATFDENVRATASYFFARPTDFLNAFWNSISSYFTSLFRGAVFDYQRDSFSAMIRPITESMTNSVPLILAGLSVAVAFRAGLFNIGAQGQLILGALTGGFVGIAWHLPLGLHMIVTLAGAALGGAIWGSIPGFLKAKVGANEVIVTIMLNSIALFLLSYALKTETYIGAGGIAGKSQKLLPTAYFWQPFGPPFRIHIGILIAIAAALFVWWLLERSTLGFEIRAAGANPNAARTAGVSVNRTIIITMVIAGALAGMAASGPIMGTEHFLSNGVAASFGFDAITVALLGRSRPIGVVFAGLLFGALNAGAAQMQAAAGIPVDIVQVAQAIIVLLIAAPPLVRWILRLPEPQGVTTQPRSRAPKKEAVA